ncbi:MAG: Translation initiation factor [Pseudomonadota bacterium]
MSKSKKDNFPKANRDIRAREVRLVGADGEMIGVVSIEEAMRKASEAGLDLVEISPQAEPPVCKILDFGKYKYESKKRLQDSKKKQKVVVLKEVKFRPNIGQHDFDIKVRHIEKFLAEGDKVKVSLWFRGREIVHNEIGAELFKRIIEVVGDKSKLELEPRLEGKQIMMIMVPPKVAAPE